MEREEDDNGNTRSTVDGSTDWDIAIASDTRNRIGAMAGGQAAGHRYKITKNAIFAAEKRYLSRLQQVEDSLKRS